ncbi:MAG: hypothetical protein OEV21_01130 [Thermoplasmata archaeon]|nr:hypothetical protein [Thermoplasmata archaeon]
MSDEKMPDAEELKNILNTVSTEIPKLLEAIGKVLYNPENADQLGKAVAQFYKGLLDAGMTKEQAYELTRQYMSSFSLGGMISSAISAGKNQEKHD